MNTKNSDPKYVRNPLITDFSSVNTSESIAAGSLTEESPGSCDLARHRDPGRLFRRLFPSGESEPFFAALADASRDVEAARGRTAARRWLRAQILRSAPGLILNSFAWRLHMLAADLKVARRSLIRHKGFAAITIAGLAAGAAACLLISLYVSHELSFDGYHRDVDRIHRLLVTSSFSKGRPMPSTSELAAPTLRRDFPEIETTARVQSFWSPPRFGSGANVFAETGIYHADPEIFAILTIPSRRGRPEEGLARPGTIVLTESLAVKHFSRRDPVGETLIVDGEPREVAAVIADPPANSHLQYRAFLPYLEVEGEAKVPDWTRYDPFTYVKLRPGTDLAAFAPKVARLSEPYLVKRSSDDPGQQYSLQPVRAIHLSPATSGHGEVPANPQTLLLLSGLALLVLGLAILNFVNLSTARSADRAKEVGIRKTIGAEKGRLVRQFMGESFLVAALAFLTGLLAAAAMLRPFNRFAGTSFALADLIRPNFLIIGAALLLFTSLAAGLYPAFVLSSLRPAAILRRDASIRLGAGRLRRVFVIGQFAAAVALIAGTLAMDRQIRFMKTAPLGFDRDQKLVLVFPRGMGSLPSGVSGGRQEYVKQEMLRVPGVRSATLSSSVPGRGFFFNGTRLPDEDSKQSRRVHYLMADEAFLEDYEITLAAGRPILPGGAGREILLNETAMRLFDWPAPEAALGRKLVWGMSPDEPMEIVGIVRDFHLEGLQAAVKPLGIGMGGSYHMLTLTFEPARLRGVLDGARRSWTANVPDEPFDYFFLDQDFARQYAREERSAAMLSTFAGLGIVIACLGLVGMASFLAAKRTKEIGIRKVLGASVPGILGLLAREFAIAVVVANAFAWPLAWYAANQWLRNFAFRADPTLGTFLAAGALALLMAMLSVGWRSIRAARAEPVKCLRYE